MSYPSIAYHLQGATLGLRPIAETSDTQWHPLGTQAVAQDTNYGVAQFLYLAGCASTEPGDVVCYNLKTGATVRAVHGGATSTGPLAVAMSANVAGQWGWYAVFGAVPVNAATVAADVPLYLTATAGQVDDTVVSGDKISGIITRAATSGGFATCQLAYPEVTAESVTAAMYSALTGILKTTLTAEAENAGANTIEVEGQVSNILGVAVAATTEVMVRSFAITANQGDITIGVGANPGTLTDVYNPANGVNEAWITTTAAGHFRFIVTNTAAETNLVWVLTPGGLPAILKLTFA